MNKLIALFCGLAFFTACSSSNGVQVNGQPMELEDGLYAKFNTSEGEMLLELAHEKAPFTVANFVALAEGTHPELAEKDQGKPFYDGLIFHRVIPDFMIQGGDPEGTGMGGPGYKFEDETNTSLTHQKGVISMANSGPNTNGSQFFITVAETPHLDGRHSVFGKVVAGQQVADSISLVETNEQNRPQTPVVIETLEIIRQGEAAKNFDAAEKFKEIREQKEKQEEMREKAMSKRLDSLRSQADSTASGLFYQVIEEGEGVKPEIGQTVLMNYSGYLLDGSLFDTSIEEIAKENNKYNAQRQYQPFPVTVGPQARVIAGWKEALSMMQVGDKWKLIIPPDLGYGVRGYPPVIPANAWLVFDVEMVDIKQ